MTPATLKLFFCDDADQPIAAACDLAAAHKALEAAARGVPAPMRGGLTSALATALDDVFQVPLGDVLGASWKKAAVLREGLEATREDPAKVVVVPLMDHKVTSKHQPHVDLMFSGKALHRLVFDIALTMELKGVQLQVREGRIAGLTSGECLGHGVFSMGGQDIIKRSTPAFALPGRLQFGA